jgi:ABC-2 type transport system ATP-binding protein
MDAAIELSGLTKRYGRRVAVDRLDLVLPRGGVIGFLGPNGAGKTTTMAMLLGLVRPSGGDGAVLGAPLGDPGAYLHRVGALIEEPAFYPALTGRENLELLATLADHDPASVPALLARVGLAGRGDDRFRGYSMGMRQRLGIAAALLGDPELLILDEPANGLDPAGIREMWRLVGRLGGEERTVLVSSHVVRELEDVCDRLVVMDRGALRFCGPVDELTGGASRLVATPERQADVERLRELVGAGARAAGIPLAELTTGRSSLEQGYLDLLEGSTP